jgi:hypothetical protein
VEEIDAVLRGMQNGDIKLRVRALEAERALVRVAAVQKAQTQGMVTACAANIGTVLLVSELAWASTAATVAFAATGLFGLLTLGSLLSVAALDKKEAKYSGK